MYAAQPAVAKQERPRTLPQKFASFACVLAVASAAAPAWALGTASVQHRDGVSHLYPVSIRVIGHRGLRISREDGRGTLVIRKAACSHAGELEKCLPYSITVEILGKSQPVDFLRGTEYVNPTASFQHLPLSSNQIAPHGLLLFLVTGRGTMVTVRGTIDGTSV